MGLPFRLCCKLCECPGEPFGREKCIPRPAPDDEPLFPRREVATLRQFLHAAGDHRMSSSLEDLCVQVAEPEDAIARNFEECRPVPWERRATGNKRVALGAK